MQRAARVKHALKVLPFLLMWGLLGCGDGEALFTRLPSSHTGIDFANTITEDDVVYNPIVFDYIYNGGGVAVGDFDGDGLDDVYFTGNQVSNKLYLNQGGFRFEDVTEAAGVAASDVWATGAAAVDINADGRLDLYVSVAGKVPVGRRANLLFVNQGTDADGVPHFSEEAAAYGLADTGYSTQAAFLDYDRDGDLDLYLLTNDIDEPLRNSLRPRRTSGQARSTDRLYRNGGDGTFTDVSEAAGITIEGYGLGLAVADVNRDGWPDVYVANDFITNDLLWINNQDGTFANQAADYLAHQSLNGMGADIADINNDGLVDAAVVDMLPPGNERQKMMLPGGNYDKFEMALRLDYEPQYVRNTLQLGLGDTPVGTPRFSEIGQLAGVNATDWSWAPLLADFDNDGWRDLLVTNGYGRDVTDLDFIVYNREANMMGTPETKRTRVMAAFGELPEVKLPNVVFQNNGDLTFTEKTKAWGMDVPSLSNGAAFADFDQDGDLDVVVNNIDDEAFVYENRASEQPDVHYLRARLDGPAQNPAGFGAKVILRNGGRQQYHDHSPYRGYKSTVERAIHFGLGSVDQVDSLEVHWPDGTYQLLRDVRADQTITLRHQDAAPRSPGEVPLSPRPAPRFREVASEHGLTFTHEETEFVDFKETPLLPHKHSAGGPGLAVGDVDGNGLDDVYVGGDRGQARVLFMQRAPGQFEADTLQADVPYDDMGALFFDAEGDGDLDLYVVSGGSHVPANDAAYQDRLYLNSSGTLRHVPDALPTWHSSGSSVEAADYDGDGDLDLFVGGRVLPGRYPLPPRSVILRNDTEGGTTRFTDVTDEIAPGLADVGLVSDALWTDVDNDGLVDLLVVGEWMPITLFKNRGGRFTDATRTSGLGDTAGWWNSLVAADFDRDGDTDYVVGNLGLNTKYQASEKEPVRIYAADFDENGSIDPVITRYIEGELYADASRDLMILQMIGMKRRFQSYTDYARAAFDETLSQAEREKAYTAESVTFETSYLENHGDGTFTRRALPLRAQFAPTFGMLPGDYNQDGHTDLLMVGNTYAPDVQTGRHDASVGALLAGDGRGGFEAVAPAESGFFASGDAKGMAEVVIGEDRALLLISQNDDSLRVFSEPDTDVRYVRLQPLDRYAILTSASGATWREEFYYGATYLSQSSRVLRLPSDVEKVVIYDGRGGSRVVASEPPEQVRTSVDG